MKIWAYQPIFEQMCKIYPSLCKLESMNQFQRKIANITHVHKKWGLLTNFCEKQSLKQFSRTCMNSFLGNFAKVIRYHAPWNLLTHFCKKRVQACPISEKTLFMGPISPNMIALTLLFHKLGTQNPVCINLSNFCKFSKKLVHILQFL